MKYILNQDEKDEFDALKEERDHPSIQTAPEGLNAQAWRKRALEAEKSLDVVLYELADSVTRTQNITLGNGRDRWVPRQDIENLIAFFRQRAADAFVRADRPTTFYIETILSQQLRRLGHKDPGECHIIGPKHALHGDRVYCRNHHVEFAAPNPCPKGRGAIYDKLSGAPDKVAVGQKRDVSIAFTAAEGIPEDTLVAVSPSGEARTIKFGTMPRPPQSLDLVACLKTSRFASSWHDETRIRMYRCVTCHQDIKGVDMKRSMGTIFDEEVFHAYNELWHKPCADLKAMEIYDKLPRDGTVDGLPLVIVLLGLPGRSPEYISR